MNIEEYNTRSSSCAILSVKCRAAVAYKYQYEYSKYTLFKIYISRDDRG
jgi:hypothetical protein